MGCPKHSAIRAILKHTSENISPTASCWVNIPMTAPVITPDKIAMTAPVISDADTMSFVLPASYQREDVPEPVDSRIIIQEVPPRELAVIRFSGRASARDVAEVRERLLTTLDAEKIPVAGRPFLMRYNAPYTPGFLRRNEVGVEIKRGN